jgi:hypothetical protein
VLGAVHASTSCFEYSRPDSSARRSASKGIVSKRKDSPYRRPLAGLAEDEEPACTAVKPEEEEDWGR